MLIKTSFTAGLLLFATAPALAREAAAQATQRVSFADLNLATPAGVAALDRRIEQAIRRACGDAFPRDLAAQAEMRGCRASMRAGIADRRDAAVAVAGRPATSGLAAGGMR